MNIDEAIRIASEAASSPYNNDAGLEDILRAGLEAVGPWIAAQALREHKGWILAENYIDQDLSVRECVIDLDARADELDPS